MIAVGVGCRRACPAEDIVDLVRAALAHLPGDQAEGLFTLADKRGEPGLERAAAILGLPLVFLDLTALRLAAGGVRSHSPRVKSLYGLPCVAETAALAGAGPGAVLLVARQARPTATCAVAGKEAP